MNESTNDITSYTTRPSSRSVPRPTTTYRMRRRRLSPKRQAELDEWTARWCIDDHGEPLDWPTVFGRVAPVHADVGFGHGETTISFARLHPGVDVVGIEVHDPGVVTVLEAIEFGPLPNVRVVHGDVLAFLDRIRPESVHGFSVFFPDPWTKVRQRHRRLLHADTVAALADRLVIGGTMEIATDIDDYAAQIATVLAAESRLDGGAVERPTWRPMTRFERRGIEAGRTVHDFRAVRRSSLPSTAH